MLFQGYLREHKYSGWKRTRAWVVNVPWECVIMGKTLGDSFFKPEFSKLNRNGNPTLRNCYGEQAKSCHYQTSSEQGIVSEMQNINTRGDCED